MKVSYYKDYKYNYIVFKKEYDCEDRYQSKMITENKIEGLLGCKEQHMNGEQLLYYNISSKQNLSRFYETHTIAARSVKRILLQLKTTCRSISKFLLEEEKILLKPEYIFIDPETEELSFIYYPFFQEESSRKELLEFLAEKVDPEDTELVNMVYKMLEYEMRGIFMLEDALSWIEQTEEPAVEEWEPAGGYPLQEWEEEAEPERMTQKEILPAGINVRMIYKAGLAAGLAGILALLSVFAFYELSDREKQMALLGLAACGVCFLTNAALLLREKWYKKKKPGYGHDGSGSGEKSRQQELESRMLPEPAAEKEQKVFGNTVFIPWTENCENKLYGVGKGNKYHIDLNRLPISVGKLAGSVDMIIDDASISRRHAKFYREGMYIKVEDLNSTNGVFKNGLRLTPNTSEILEPGDEIRLGKLKFIYR